MGIFTNILTAKHTEKRSSGSGIPDFLLGNAASRSGIAVNEASALSLSPVWSVIDRISGIVGVFPFKTYKNNDDNTISQIEHPALKLLNKEPNEYQSGYELKYITMSNMLLHGCGAIQIEYKGGFPSTLTPIHPTNIQVVNTNGKLSYRVTAQSGTQTVLQGHQLLLFKLFPKADGTWWSPLQTHRAIFEEALALREFSSTVFSQGCNPAGVITDLPDGMTEESRNTLLETLKGYVGLGKSHQLMVLPTGKFERVSAPSTDLQYIETRRFQISEFSRLWGIPLHLLSETDKSTSWGSGIAEQNQHFVQFVLSRFLVNWEAELNKKLFSVDDDKIYGKFVVDGLLRGNPKDRWEAYRTAASLGVYSINEIRDLEERNPLDDPALGDARLIPMNFTTLKNAVEGKNIKDVVPDPDDVKKEDEKVNNSGSDDNDNEKEDKNV